MTTIIKPAAKLEGALLLARKGEAMPAVAANEHTNPGLAWGAPPPHPMPAAPIGAAMSAHSARPVAQHQPPSGSARLRPESFLSAQSKQRMTKGAQPDRDPVAMTVRVEDETYLRLRYLAQTSGRSPQQVMTDALDQHLRLSGVPSTRKLVIKPE